MKKPQYIKIGLIIFVFIFVNLVPLNLAFLSGSEIGPPDIRTEIYPNPPQNMSFLNTDTTVTLLIKNHGTEPEEIEYDITGKSENLFVNGRDGNKLPHKMVVDNGKNYYQSFALVPLNPFQDKYHLGITVKSQRENLSLSEDFTLRLSIPDLNRDNLESIVSGKGDPSKFKFFLVPRYRRYWHPELSEVGEASVEYIWIAVSGENNLVIDDESRELIAQNIELPWKTSDAPEFGLTELWSGSGFTEKEIPSPKLRGDNSFNKQRFELYFASRENHPAWVTRRILYWTSENLVEGRRDEIPDTERVELWISAENGEKLSTISDYHHYAFRYKPVESYTIQDFWHCPIPSGYSLEWFVFTLVNYKNVYPSSSTYLFSINGNKTMTDNLNDGEINSELESEFREEYYDISNKASVVEIEKNKSWKISDEGKIYIIENKRGKLNIYSRIKHDHLGFSEKIHPIDRALEEKMPLIKRNLIGVGMAALILIIPYSWNRWIKNHL